MTLYLPALGPLSPKVSTNAGTNPSGVAIGDIDSDGKNEVVVCNSNSDDIYVFNTSNKDGRLDQVGLLLHQFEPMGYRHRGPQQRREERCGRLHRATTRYAM